ncbi:MAG: hypothetical protein U0N26_06825 [Faecalibacterium prausnitzii]
MGSASSIGGTDDAEAVWPRPSITAAPAQHHRCPGQRGAACPGQERPPPEPAPPGAASSPPLGHASSCIL